ncbi:MAG TPA: phage capsid protein [Sulfurospirillum cavolei]|uniref:Phage capsid protein n=1 Tax=Sulfurospirillum cavolei TaxID=366522 RepID=A0A2D3W9Z0_9BACT|nr:MAG TPA: phage capsid protein [Sulfurospirillum cavolei]
MIPQFVYSPEYTAIAIAYRNTKLIADLVLPRVPVSKKEFKYIEYPLADSFTVPDTLFPKKGTPNIVDFGGSDVTSMTIDYGLDDPISNDDIANAPEGSNLEGKGVEYVTDLVALAREVRAAALLFNANSYASSKTLALTGTDRFDDYENSDPLAVLVEALDTPLMRPNTMTIGRKAFSKLAMHPKVVKAANGNAGDSGIATKLRIAEILELDNIFVGEGWLNTAKKGQTAVMQRVWGNDISLTYLNSLADTQRGVTFGFTAQYGTKQAGANPVALGINGSMLVRSAESVKELIVAKDVGFLLTDVIS